MGNFLSRLFKGKAWREVERTAKETRKDMQPAMERLVKQHRKELQSVFEKSLEIATERLTPVATDALIQTLLADIPDLVARRAKEAEKVL